MAAYATWVASACFAMVVTNAAAIADFDSVVMVVVDVTVAGAGQWTLRRAGASTEGSRLPRTSSSPCCKGTRAACPARTSNQ